MTTDGDRKLRVLFADDDEDLLGLVKMKLSSQGFLVSLSLNGERIKERVLSERPDIILLDVTMRGNDGRDICSHLKKNAQIKAIPVILLSANERLDAIADQCGADAWVAKPFDAVSVKSKIEDLLSKRPSGRQDLL